MPTKLAHEWERRRRWVARLGEGTFCFRWMMRSLWLTVVVVVLHYCTELSSADNGCSTSPFFGGGTKKKKENCAGEKCNGRGLLTRRTRELVRCSLRRLSSYLGRRVGQGAGLDTSEGAFKQASDLESFYEVPDLRPVLEGNRRVSCVFTRYCFSPFYVFFGVLLVGPEPF